MKKILLTAIFVFISTLAFAQKPVVAVAPFDAISGITAADANVITRIFNNRLGNTNIVILVDRSIVERVIREHQFQLGDWSNSQKTAELGEALNADWIVRGEIERLGANIIITVQFYDIRTFQFKGGADIPLSNVNEAYNKIAPLVDNLVQTIGGNNKSLNPIRSMLDRGIDYYNRGDYDNAIIELSEAIRLNSNLAEAYNYRGLSYLYKWDSGRLVESARADLTAAIRLDPYNAVYYFNRAATYRQNSSSSTFIYNEQVLEELSQAIRLDPHNAMYYVQRGFVYFEMAIGANTRDWENTRSNSSYFLNKTIEDCTQAIALNPRYVEAYHWRAWAYETKNDYHMAMQDFTHIINLYPYNGTYIPTSPELYKAEAHYSRARCWERNGNQTESDADYAMAEALGYEPK